MKLPEGTTIQCESKHNIATTRIPLQPATSWSVDWFDWHIDKPRDGDTIGDCPHCDRRYSRVVDTRAGRKTQLLVAGEWWPTYRNFAA